MTKVPLRFADKSASFCDNIQRYQNDGESPHANC
jgi:hypothetical protein